MSQRVSFFKVTSLCSEKMMEESQRNGSIDYDSFVQHRRAFYEIFTKIRAEHPDMPLKDVGRLTAWKTVEQAPKSRAIRRIQAQRKMMGTKLRMSKDKLLGTTTGGAGDENDPLVSARKVEVTVA